MPLTVIYPAEDRASLACYSEYEDKRNEFNSVGAFTIWRKNSVAPVDEHVLLIRRALLLELQIAYWVYYRFYVIDNS